MFEPKRIVIGGGPRTGKTTLAEDMGGGVTIAVRHTDTLIEDRKWEEISERACEWLDRPGPWLVEGVAAVRALRKWMEKHPRGKPCDRLIWRRHPFTQLSVRQAALMKGCEKILKEISPQLKRRGIDVVFQ